MKKLTEDILKEINDCFEKDAFKSVFEITEKSSDDESGTFEVIISDETLDRYGEIIKLDGWDLTHYKKNPVVLWGHDHRELPVGYATKVFKKDGKLIAKGKFTPEEANPMGQQIRRLYDLGILRATSVGFIAREMEGNTITKAELLEFSFVTVPANPSALSTLVKSGININELCTKGFMEISIKDVEEVPTEDVPTEDEPAVVPDEETPEETPAEEKSAEEEVPAEEAPADEPIETPADETVAPEDVKLFKKNILAKLTSIRSEVEALEESLEEDGPEGDETEPAEEDAELKAFKRFNEGRRFMQLASTALSESLAEARKAVYKK